jgi:hypothetical protein
LRRRRPGVVHRIRDLSHVAHGRMAKRLGHQDESCVDGGSWVMGHESVFYSCSCVSKQQPQGGGPCGPASTQPPPKPPPTLNHRRTWVRDPRSRAQLRVSQGTMRAPRTVRVRTLSNKELEVELVGALVDWLTSPGVTTPPPRLASLYGAYSRRFPRHSAECACEECWWADDRVSDLTREREPF